MKNLDYNTISAISFRVNDSVLELPMFKFGSVKKTTEKAICLYVSRWNSFGKNTSGNCWIPKSQIIDIVDGIAVVPEWLCKKISLI